MLNTMGNIKEYYMKVSLKYHGKVVPFNFIEINEHTVRGRLKLDKLDREQLLQSESDDDLWYLDENGERLEAAALFEASPWSMTGPQGEIKLLARFHSPEGEIHFQTLKGYGGELFDWVRKK